jgi:hypothetical protein
MILAMLPLVLSAATTAPAAEKAKHNVLVMTGGQVDQWRFVFTLHFGEHLIFGPRQLNAARAYYYKGLTDYVNRFDRYLKPIPDADVKIINLDRQRPDLSFDEVDLLVLDDVRADAFEKYQEAVASYLDAGGRCIVVAGQSMLGGEELQADEIPSLDNALLIDPPHDYTPYERLPWTLYATESSWRDTPVQKRLPVEIISQPDLIVYDRRSAAVGGKVLDVQVVKPHSFAASVPLDALNLMGYHKIRAAEGAEVLATIGPERDPLLIRRDNIVVFTAHELETAVRANGQPSNSSINSPEIDSELGLPHFSEDLMLAAANSLLFSQRARLQLPKTVVVGQPVQAQLDPLEDSAKIVIEPIDTDAWLKPVARTTTIDSSQASLSVNALPEGNYRVQLLNERAGELASAADDLTITPDPAVSIVRPARWTVDQAEGGEITLAIQADKAIADAQAVVALFDQSGRRIAEHATHLGSIVEDRPTELAATISPALPIGDYAMQLTLQDRTGTVYRRLMFPVAVVEQRGSPDSFVMIAGNNPSHFVFQDLRSKGVVMTAQTPSLGSMLAYLEQHGGIPRAYGFQYPQLGPEDRFENWKGEAVGDFSWADPDFQKAWLGDLTEIGNMLDGRLMNPIVLFDDEPKVPMAGGWEAAQLFKERTGLDAPTPQRRLDDRAYLDHWTRWEDFRVSIWADHYARGSEQLKQIDPRLKTAVVVEGMGKDIYAGFDPARSQAGLDIYWYHIYPLNEPMLMVGHAVERGLSAMRAMGQDKPTWALLQNWANQADVPRVPSPQYLSAQYWMAIAHGAETVGFWPYTYGFWISPGSPGWQRIGQISEQQRWLSPLLAELSPVRKPIALLYSTSQAGVDHLVGLTAQKPQDHAEPWHNWHANEEAYFALKTTGLPVETLEESELIATGGDLPHKAIVLSRVNYLRPEARQAIERFIDAGGSVFVDQSSTIDLGGTKTLPVAMDELFDLIFPAGGFDGWNRYKHRDDWQPITRAHAQAIRPLLQRFDSGRIRVTSDGPMQWNLLDGGAVKFLFLVNDNVQTEDLEQYRQVVEDWRLTPATWSPVAAKVNIDQVDAVYDVIAHERMNVKTTAGRMSWSAQVDGAQGRMFALFDTAPTALALEVADSADAGQVIRCEVELLTEDGRRLDADLPLQLVWRGQVVDHTALSDGTATVEVLVDALTPPGRYVLKAVEPVTGLAAEATVRISGTPDASSLLGLEIRR